MSLGHENKVQIQHECCEREKIQQACKWNHAHSKIAKLLSQGEAFEEISIPRKFADVAEKNGNAANDDTNHERHGHAAGQNGRQHAGTDQCATGNQVSKVGRKQKAPIGISQTHQNDDMSH